MVIVKTEPTVVSGVGCGAMAVENNGRGRARQVGFHQGNGNHFRGNRDGRPRSHQPIKIGFYDFEKLYFYKLFFFKSFE